MVQQLVTLPYGRRDAVVVATEERLKGPPPTMRTFPWNSISARNPVFLHSSTSLSMSCIRRVPKKRPVPANAGMMVLYCITSALRPYHLIKLGQEDLDIAKHRTTGTVTCEVGLGPNVAVGTISLLLVLQEESRDRWVVATLLCHIAHTAFCCINDTRKGFANDWVVWLFTALFIIVKRKSYVSLVVPAREVPLENEHEAFVRIITL